MYRERASQIFYRDTSFCLDNISNPEEVLPTLSLQQLLEAQKDINKKLENTVALALIAHDYLKELGVCSHQNFEEARKAMIAEGSKRELAIEVKRLGQLLESIKMQVLLRKSRKFGQAA